MKEEQKQCDSQPAQSQKTLPRISRVTLSVKKILTAEQYRDWQCVAATLRENISRYAE